MDEMNSDLPTAVAAVMTSPQRLGVLRSVVPDMAVPDADFRELAEIAADLFSAPIALVTLVDMRHQWFKAAAGTTETQAFSTESFCVHAIAAPFATIPKGVAPGGEKRASGVILTLPSPAFLK